MRQPRAPRDFYHLGAGDRPLSMFDLQRMVILLGEKRITQADIDHELAARRADNERMRQHAPSLWGGKLGNGYSNDR